MGYSLQATSKQKEGAQHVDRDAQFHHINDTAVSFMSDGQPVISVDTKKKGARWGVLQCRQGVPAEEDAHENQGARLHRPRDGKGHPLWGL